MKNKERKTDSANAYILNLMRPHKALAIQGIILAILACLFSVGASYTIKVLIDDVFVSRNPSLLWPIQLLFVGLVLLNALCNIFKESKFIKLSQAAAKELQDKIFTKIFRVKLSEVAGERQGEVLSVAMNDVADLASIMSQSYPSLLASVIAIIITLSTMFYLHYQLALLCLIVIPIQIVIFILVQNKLSEISQRYVGSRGNLSSQLTEILRGNTSVRILQIEEPCKARLSSTVNDLYHNNYKLGLLGAFMAQASWVLILVPFQAIMYGIAGGWFFASGTPSLGLMLAFANYGNSLVGPIMTVVNFLKDMKYANVCVERINEFLSAAEDGVSEERENTLDTDDMDPIYVKNAKLKYGDKVVTELRDITFHSHALNLIYGASGSGKTTLLRSFVGFVDFEGEIYFNDKPLNSIAVDSLRQNISFVEQETFLFSGSLRENFTIFEPTLSDEDIAVVLEQVQLHSFASNLDMKVSAAGENLSGGEKLRLSIARAILRKTPIILLDEPTAALDDDNSHAIYQLLTSIKDQRTIILASHDPISREYADSMWNIEN